MQGFEYINEFVNPSAAKKIAAQLNSETNAKPSAVAVEKAEALFEKALDAEERGSAFLAKCYLNDAIAVLEGRRQ